MENTCLIVNPYRRTGTDGTLSDICCRTRNDRYRWNLTRNANIGRFFRAKKLDAAGRTVTDSSVEETEHTNYSMRACRASIHAASYNHPTSVTSSYRVIVPSCLHAILRRCPDAKANCHCSEAPERVSEIASIESAA